MQDLLARLAEASDKKDMARAEELSSTINRTGTMFTSSGTGTSAERERDSIAFLNSIEAELNSAQHRSVYLIEAAKTYPRAEKALRRYLND